MPHSPCIELEHSEQRQLLAIARQSIDTGLREHRALSVDIATVPDPLQARRGVFVTLSLDGDLRGCIGAMQSSLPLAQSVADSAYGAAFRDPRFQPVSSVEITHTRIEISILSGMEDFQPGDREDLLASLRPEVDGLLLWDGPHRSTFLPKVWEQLPQPDDFLRQLLAKADLPQDYWSGTLRFQRYSTATFSE